MILSNDTITSSFIYLNSPNLCLILFFNKTDIIILVIEPRHALALQYPIFSFEFHQSLILLMAKLKSTFFCQNCGVQHAKWLGKCNSCNEWNTIVEEIVEKKSPTDKKNWTPFSKKQVK